MYLTVKAPDFQSAFDMVEPIFDTVRGIIELTLGLGSMQLSSPPKPRRKVPCPSWGLGLADGVPTEYKMFFVDAENQSHTPICIGKQDVDALRTNSALTARPRAIGTLYDLLVDGLRLYSQAMDARYDYECFLGLWQLAEALTLANQHQGAKKVVCPRLAWFGQNSQGVHARHLNVILAWLYEKRNEIVHRGLHQQVTQDDVNVLKICCDSALVWLSGHVKAIPTVGHLEQFYSMKDHNDCKLDTLGKVLQFVKGYRRKKVTKEKRSSGDYGDGHMWVNANK